MIITIFTYTYNALLSEQKMYFPYSLQKLYNCHPPQKKTGSHYSRHTYFPC